MNESSEQGTGVAVRCSLAGQGSGGLEEGGSVEETEFFGGLEAGTGFGRGSGHLVVATGEGLGELLLERFQEADKSRPLGKGAGVLRTAGLVGGQQAVADGLYTEHGLGVLLVEHHRVFAYFVGFAHKAILFGLGLNNRVGWSSAFRMQRYDIFYGRWRKMAQDWRPHPVGN